MDVHALPLQPGLEAFPPVPASSCSLTTYVVFAAIYLHFQRGTRLPWPSELLRLTYELEINKTPIAELEMSPTMAPIPGPYWDRASITTELQITRLVMFEFPPDQEYPVPIPAPQYCE
jgi:hypothetical protein